MRLPNDVGCMFLGLVLSYVSHQLHHSLRLQTLNMPVKKTQDSEGHTTDPVVDPDALLVQARRRRRTRGPGGNKPEADERPGNVEYVEQPQSAQHVTSFSDANQTRIVELLSQLVAKCCQSDSSRQQSEFMKFTTWPPERSSLAWRYTSCTAAVEEQF